MDKKEKGSKATSKRSLIPSTSDTVFIDQSDDATMLLIQNESQKQFSGSKALILNDLAQTHKRFEAVVQTQIEIGRAPNMPGIEIDYDNRISKHHCLITNKNGELWITDLGSKNKTIINDKFVTEPRVLKSNDIIVLGKTGFLYLLNCDNM